MKYIIAPPFKILWALALSVFGIAFYAFLISVYFLWYFKLPKKEHFVYVLCYMSINLSPYFKRGDRWSTTVYEFTTFFHFIFNINPQIKEQGS